MVIRALQANAPAITIADPLPTDRPHHVSLASTAATHVHASHPRVYLPVSTRGYAVECDSFSQKIVECRYTGHSFQAR